MLIEERSNALGAAMTWQVIEGSKKLDLGFLTFLISIAWSLDFKVFRRNRLGF